MKKEDTQIIILAVLAVIVLVMLPNLNTFKFAISDNNFNYMGTQHPTVYSINNASETINFAFMTTNETMTSGTIFYTLNNATDIYSSTPTDLTGTNEIFKWRISTQDNLTAVLEEWSLVYSVNTVQNVTYVQNVSYVQNISYQNVTIPVTFQQICLAVNGTWSSNTTCTCQDNSTWTNSSTNQICPPITNNIQPTFFQKYGIAGIIFIVLGLIIIYLIYKRTR